eukprot:gene936-802_t
MGLGSVEEKVIGDRAVIQSAAEAVLENQREIMLLEKTKNATREALASLRRKPKHDKSSKAWYVLGQDSMLLMHKGAIEDHLKAEQREQEKATTQLRDEGKQQMRELYELDPKITSMPKPAAELLLKQKKSEKVSQASTKENKKQDSNSKDEKKEVEKKKPVADRLDYSRWDKMDFSDSEDDLQEVGDYLADDADLLSPEELGQMQSIHDFKYIMLSGCSWDLCEGMAQLLRIAVLESSGEPGEHAVALLENCTSLAGDLQTEYIKTVAFLYGKSAQHLASNLRLRVTSFVNSAVPKFWKDGMIENHCFDARSLVRLLTVIAYREAFREGSDVPEALRQNQWVLKFLRPIFDIKTSLQEKTNLESQQKVNWATLPDSTLLQEQVLLFLALALPQRLLTILKNDVKQFPKIGYNTRTPETPKEWKVPESSKLKALENGERSTGIRINPKPDSVPVPEKEKNESIMKNESTNKQGRGRHIPVVSKKSISNICPALYGKPPSQNDEHVDEEQENVIEPIVTNSTSIGYEGGSGTQYSFYEIKEEESNETFQNILAMPDYRNNKKSLEELRLEDYLSGRKLSTVTSVQTAPTLLQKQEENDGAEEDDGKKKRKRGGGKAKSKATPKKPARKRTKKENDDGELLIPTTVHADRSVSTMTPFNVGNLNFVDEATNILPKKGRAKRKPRGKKKPIIFTEPKYLDKESTTKVRKKSTKKRKTVSFAANLLDVIEYQKQKPYNEQEELNASLKIEIFQKCVADHLQERKDSLTSLLSTPYTGLQLLKLSKWKKQSQYVTKKVLIKNLSRILPHTSTSSNSDDTTQTEKLGVGSIVRVKNGNETSVLKDVVCTTFKYRYTKIPIRDVLGVGFDGVHVRFAHDVQRVNIFKIVEPENNYFLDHDYSLKGRKFVKVEKLPRLMKFQKDEIRIADDITNTLDNSQEENVTDVSSTFCHNMAKGMFDELDCLSQNCVCEWIEDTDEPIPSNVKGYDSIIGYDLASTNSKVLLTPASATLLSLSIGAERLPTKCINKQLLQQVMLLAMREKDLQKNVNDILKKTDGELNFLYSPIDKKNVGQASSFLWFNLLVCNKKLVNESWQREGLFHCSSDWLQQNNFTSSHLFRFLHDQKPNWLGLKEMKYPKSGAIRPNVEFKHGNFDRSPISDFLEDSLVDTWTALLSFAHGESIDTAQTETDNTTPTNNVEKNVKRKNTVLDRKSSCKIYLNAMPIQILRLRLRLPHPYDPKVISIPDEVLAKELVLKASLDVKSEWQIFTALGRVAIDLNLPLRGQVGDLNVLQFKRPGVTTQSKGATKVRKSMVKRSQQSNIREVNYDHCEQKHQTLEKKKKKKEDAKKEKEENDTSLSAKRLLAVKNKTYEIELQSGNRYNVKYTVLRRKFEEKGHYYMGSHLYEMVEKQNRTTIAENKDLYWSLAYQGEGDVQSVVDTIMECFVVEEQSSAVPAKYNNAMTVTTEPINELNPFFMALSKYRRRKYDAAIDICSNLLRENSLDQAAWFLKVRSFTCRDWIDDLEIDEEGVADAIMDENSMAACPRPGTSLKRPLTSAADTSGNGPNQGVRPPTASGFLRAGQERGQTAANRDDLSTAMKNQRPGTSQRPLTSLGRLVRLGTASMQADGEGVFIRVEHLDLAKYAQRPIIAKALCDYLLYYMHNPRRALELASEATAVCDYKDWWWKARIGKCQYQLGMYREAEKQFKSSLKDENMVATHLELAKVYLRLDQPMSTLDQYGKCAERFQGDVSLLLGLARVHDLINDVSTSISFYRQVLNFDSMNPEALACLASHHFYTDQPEVALRFYRRLLQIGVSNAELWNNLGLCCFYAQQYDMALGCFDRAISMAEDKAMADVWYNVAHVAIGVGDTGLAYQCLKVAISVDPNHAESYNNIGVLELRKGKADAAQANFNTSMQQGLHLYESSHNAALLSFKLGDFQESSEFSNKSLEVYPDHQDSLELKQDQCFSFYQLRSYVKFFHPELEIHSIAIRFKCTWYRTSTE